MREDWLQMRTVGIETERTDALGWQARTAHLGLDVGATSLVLVLIDDEENIIDSQYCMLSGERKRKNLVRHAVCSRSCETCSHPCDVQLIIEKVNGFISTSYDRHGVKIVGFGVTGSQVNKDTPFSIPIEVYVSEIAAHTRGMRRASNTENVFAIIDVGGQDSKVIRLSNPLDFQMSGLCASGTGSYFEEISKLENLSLSQFSSLGAQYVKKYTESLGSAKELRIEEFSAVCTIFTKSSYIKKKNTLPLEERAGAVCWAQAKQIYNTVIHSLRDYRGQISFQGGVSFNSGVRWALDHLLKNAQSLSPRAEPVLILPEIDNYLDEVGRKKPVSHLMGALGAAILAREHVLISRKTPDREKKLPPLVSSRLRKNFLKSQIEAAFQPKETRPRVAWCGTIFPSELCYLFDIVPIALPVLAAIDQQNAQSNLLKASREEGVGRANCTILSAVLGRLDQTPVPDFIFHTSGSCDYYRQHMLRLIDIACEQYGLRPEEQVCSIDLPTFNFDNALGIEFVAHQLRDAVSRIEDTLQVKHDPLKLKQIVSNVNRARHYHILTEQLRAENEALALGSELLKRAILYSSAWGASELVDITRSYYEELKERSKALSQSVNPKVSFGDRQRILWVYLWDYTDHFLLRYLENDLNCAIVAEELNYIHWPEIDPQHPFTGIARRIVQPINHIQARLSYLLEMAEKYRIDGIIFFVHFFGHCPLASETVQNQLRNSGYPVLFLEGDSLDETRRPTSTFTKVQAFVEQLNKTKYGNIFAIDQDL